MPRKINLNPPPYNSSDLNSREWMDWFSTVHRRVGEEPFGLQGYASAGLPDPSNFGSLGPSDPFSSLIFIYDGSGPGVAYSDGTSWNIIGGGAGSVYSFNRAIGTSTQSVTSTLTAITWNSSADSSGSDVSWSGGNPTRLTVNATGVYRIGGYVTVGSSGQRAQAAAEILINGVATGLQRSGSYIRNSGTSYDYWTMDVSSTPTSLTSGDYVELGVGQVTGTTYGYGGSLTINCDRSKSEFWLERVA